MRKINLTIISGGVRRFPGCADLLGDFPEFRVLAHAHGLYDPGVCSAMGQSDVVLLEEAVVEHDGTDTIRSITETHPHLRILLIIDNENDDRVLEAVGLGVSGVMERRMIRTMLRKAIPALYAGEPWISRQLASSLRGQLKQDGPDDRGGPKYTIFAGRRIYN